MLRSNFPSARKSRLEGALERLKKDLSRPQPPEQSGRPPRELKAYRERVTADITRIEGKLKDFAV